VGDGKLNCVVAKINCNMHRAQRGREPLLALTNVKGSPQGLARFFLVILPTQKQIFQIVFLEI